jgi:hypothetical protein
MTIRELDHLIGRMLSTGPKSVGEIYAARAASNDCTQYDVGAALRIWTRNGWARELEPGTYELITIGRS